MFLCFRLVHAECDDNIDAALLQLVKNEEQTDYMCTICRNRDPDVSVASCIQLYKAFSFVDQVVLAYQV